MIKQRNIGHAVMEALWPRDRSNSIQPSLFWEFDHYVLRAMASNLVADGLQPSSHGLQPSSDVDMNCTRHDVRHGKGGTDVSSREGETEVRTVQPKPYRERERERERER